MIVEFTGLNFLQMLLWVWLRGVLQGENNMKKGMFEPSNRDLWPDHSKCTNHNQAKNNKSLFTQQLEVEKK